MKNEKGYIYPVTLLLIFFLILIFHHQIDVLLLEKMFFRETEELYVLDNIMTLGVEKVVDELEELGENVETTGTISYPHGTFQYWIMPVTTEESFVTVICTTSAKRKYRANFYYHFGEKKIKNWMEYR
jgi:competence protein ComGG